MAVLSDYTSGRISLANGSVTVTGTGTLFNVAKFREGDTLQIQNLTAVIASVNSDTSLTLTAPWTGTTLTNAVYRARYLPDGARVTAQATTLIELLGNGNLQSLAGLTGAADKGIMFTGAGTAGTFDLSEIGRRIEAITDGVSSQIIQGDGTRVAKSSLPISAATQTALDAKAPIATPVFQGQTDILRGSLRFRGDQNVNQNLIVVQEFGTQRWGIDYVYTDQSLRIQAFTGGTWTGEAVIFRPNKSVAFLGTISKAGGTFEIDHPLDPFNKNLRHGFVESTEYVNIYRGMVDLVDGRMSVDIDAAFGMTDGTFAALNADVIVSSLQNQYGPDRVWVEAPADSGKFTIICEDTESTATIAWMVTGRRNDAFVRSDLDPNTDSEGRFIPEFDKEDA
jgi:hypothetical protein